MDFFIITFLIYLIWIAAIEYLSRRLDPLFLKTPLPNAPLYEKGGNWSSFGLFLVFLSYGLPLEWLFYPPLGMAGGAAIWGAFLRIGFLVVIWIFVKEQKRRTKWFDFWNKLAVVYLAVSAVVVLYNFV